MPLVRLSEQLQPILVNNSAKGCGWMGSQHESRKGRFPGVPKVAKDIVAGTCGEQSLVLFLSCSALATLC